MRRFALRCAFVLLAALLAIPAGLVTGPDADAGNGNGNGNGNGDSNGGKGRGNGKGKAGKR